MKDGSKLQETPQTLKREYPTPQYMKFLPFFFFAGLICPTGSVSRFAFPMWIWARIQQIKINADPDPQHWKTRWLKLTWKKRNTSQSANASPTV